jgi:hypothetical protein
MYFRSLKPDHQIFASFEKIAIDLKRFTQATVELLKNTVRESIRGT